MSYQIVFDSLSMMCCRMSDSTAIYFYEWGLVDPLASNSGENCFFDSDSHYSQDDKHRDPQFQMSKSFISMGPYPSLLFDHKVKIGVIFSPMGGLEENIMDLESFYISFDQ